MSASSIWDAAWYVRARSVHVKFENLPHFPRVIFNVIFKAFDSVPHAHRTRIQAIGLRITGLSGIGLNFI